MWRGHRTESNQFNWWGLDRQIEIVGLDCVSIWMPSCILMRASGRKIEPIGRETPKNPLLNDPCCNHQLIGSFDSLRGCQQDDWINRFNWNIVQTGAGGPGTSVNSSRQNRWSGRDTDAGSHRLASKRSLILKFQYRGDWFGESPNLIKKIN